MVTIVIVLGDEANSLNTHTLTSLPPEDIEAKRTSCIVVTTVIVLGDEANTHTLTNLTTTVDHLVITMFRMQAKNNHNFNFHAIFW